MPERLEAHLLEKLASLFAAPGDLDTDSLHQTRVATRRLRVGLRFFAALYPEGELKQVRRQLRRLTGVLGEVRTMDVNIHLLRKAARRLPASTAAAQRKLVAGWLAARHTHLDALRDFRRALHTSHFQARIRQLILKPRPLDDKRLLKESNAALNQLRRELRRRYRKYRRQESLDVFHKLRLAAKRYRYALEICAAVFDTAATPRIRAVETLQDQTGICHDLEVLIDSLKVDKELAGAQDEMLAFFREEHAAQFERFEEFLSEERTWIKKVKLALPRD
ncbi:MAG: CHAD domain-containing protein [Verrucomicrobiota bacterium]